MNANYSDLAQPAPAMHPALSTATHSATTGRSLKGSAPVLEIALLTGGGDKPYAFGLATALLSKGVRLDFIGSDEVDSPALRSDPNLTFLNLRGSQRHDVGLVTKTSRIAIYYARLLRYAFVAKPKIFHILWNNKFQMFDRTLLMLYYRLQGRRIVLTAHNVNAAKRDSHDTLLNRLTLRIQYHIADHIFVHTEAMKMELREDFGVRPSSITVIPLGFNNSVPDTDLSPAQAKQRLGIDQADRVLLFFGHIGPYKGLELLVSAFQKVVGNNSAYRLLIVGKPKTGSEHYVDVIQRAIRNGPGRERVTQRIEFVPDEDTELYFKAADVLVLPYVQVFQSGVLILGYTFGLPVIAADVGSLREDIIEGETGFMCKPGDPADLAKTIDKYFEAPLFKALERHRPTIRDHARDRYSWDAVGATTLKVYAELGS